MPTDGDFTQRIAGRLQRAGWAGPAAVLLEALEPLALLAAQVGYLAQPLAGDSADDLGRLARLLEDPSSRADLAARLRAENRR